MKDVVASRKPRRKESLASTAPQNSALFYSRPGYRMRTRSPLPQLPTPPAAPNSRLASGTISIQIHYALYHIQATIRTTRHYTHPTFDMHPDTPRPAPLPPPNPRIDLAGLQPPDPRR